MIRACLLLLYDALLIGLALEDLKSRKIRNQYVTGILLLAVIMVIVDSEISVGSRILGIFTVSVPMGCISLIKPGSFGGGDMKLTLASGAFLGFDLLVRGTVIGIFFAGFYCVWLICTKRVWKNVQFAMGPFLSAGYLFVSFGILKKGFI